MRMIAMIGGFPPPMHGMAAVNLAMKDFFVSNGENPIIFDLSATSLSRSWHVRLVRAARVLRKLGAYCNFLIVSRKVTVYISVSGGYGQLFEILFILLSRLRNARIVLHHHSFLYVDRPRFLTKMLVSCAGKDAYHIALCGHMAHKLKSSYPSIRQVIVLSNSALFPLDGGARIRKSVGTLGFFGNIEADKGIFEFLEVLSRLQKEGVDIFAIIAGPFFNKATEALVRDKIAEIGNVQYVGPKYGAEKDEFFDSIDVLLYPTKNDAEPLIVLESMAQGVPVLARSRGCLDEMVAATAGEVFGFDEDYVSETVSQLRIWRECPSELMEKSRGAVEKYRQMQNTSTEVLRNLFVIILAA
ncbi:MAG: glycosyltransferase family 4 protein [Gallionella sp.]